MNRLTITLDDDLYAMARAHAISTKTSLSKAIGNLLRQRNPGLPSPAAPKLGDSFHIDPITLLPVVQGDGRPITMEDIQRSLDDEDVRHLEMMGLSLEEIERALNR